MKIKEISQKKKPTRGKITNSKGDRILLQIGRFATFGFERQSTKMTTSRLTSDSVRIADDTWGKVLPITVLPKLSFRSGGKVAPKVKMNQFTGQRK